MAHIHKFYTNPFVLEKSKLDRLVTLLRERFNSPSSDVHERYLVTHEDRTFIEVESLDALYQLHNSGRKRIKELRVWIIDKSKQTSDKERFAEVRFSDDEDRIFPVIHSLVDDEDSKWASATFALVEEQVERCIKKGGMYAFIIPSQIWKLLLPLSLVFIVFAGTLIYLPSRELANDMWLTKEDVEEIQSSLQTSSIISAEQHLTILKKQIMNLDSRLHNKPWKVTWPMLLIICPLLVVIGAIAYLVYRCYPAAVFLWGDMEEWYQGILKRRSIVWNTIILSTAVSVIAGLFLMGIEILTK